MNYSLHDIVVREIDQLKRAFIGAKAPESIIWFLTEKCNLRCEHCFVSHNERKFREELNFDLIRRVLDSSQELLERISFTGGEPLIYAEFDKVFLYASSLGKMKSLNISTNGMCNEKLFSILKDCQNERVRYQIQSSIDGPEEIHNAIRGNALAYRELVRLLDMFVSFKSKSKLALEMNLVMTVSRKNSQVVGEAIKFAEFYGVPLAINFVRSSSGSNLKAGEANDFAPKGDNGGLPIEEIKSVVCQWRRFALKNSGFFGYHLDKIKLDNIILYKKKGLWNYPCAAGINNAVIFSDGAVSICETKKPFAKLQDFDYDYRKLWKKHFDGKLYTCYCSYDCAINYSINKSGKGYWVFAKSLMGIS